MATYKVTMLRHGESAWNADNKFCGWHDADLVESGVQEAKKAAQVCYSYMCVSVVKLGWGDPGDLRSPTSDLRSPPLTTDPHLWSFMFFLS